MASDSAKRRIWCATKGCAPRSSAARSNLRDLRADRPVCSPPCSAAACGSRRVLVPFVPAASSPLPEWPMADVVAKGGIGRLRAPC
eukprot:1124028-Prymnesium_polylepis.1